RDQLPRVLPPIATGVLVVAGAVTTTAFVLPSLTLPVLLILTFAVLAAVALAIGSERGAGAARVGSRSDIIRGTAALAASAGDLRANGVAGVALARLDRAAEKLARAEQPAAWAAGLGAAVVTLATTLPAGGVPPAATDAT